MNSELRTKERFSIGGAAPQASRQASKLARHGIMGLRHFLIFFFAMAFFFVTRLLFGFFPLPRIIFHPFSFFLFRLVVRAAWWGLVRVGTGLLAPRVASADDACQGCHGAGNISAMVGAFFFLCLLCAVAFADARCRMMFTCYLPICDSVLTS